LRGLLELLLPPICAACARRVEPERALCAGCDRALPRFAGAPPPLLPEEFACASAVAYESPASEWMRRFKYPRRGFSGLDPAAHGVLRDWIVEAGAQAPGGPPDLVVPMALHAARLRARGFNPAALLARSLARSSGLRHDPVALLRVRDTASQTGLDRHARRRNVAGAFLSRRSLEATPRVWLVDDVVTTGSTAAAAARALADAGARDITVVCAARTPLESA
jgi:ComF family protein